MRVRTPYCVAGVSPVMFISVGVTTAAMLRWRRPRSERRRVLASTLAASELASASLAPSTGMST